MAGFDHRLGKGAALHQPDAVEEAVDPHVCLSLASSAKAWDGRGAAIVALRAPTAPAPGIAGLGETDFVHQPRDAASSRPTEVAKLEVDRIVAAGRADVARMAGEPVGEVDADPVAAEAAVGERRAARVGFGRRAWPRQRTARRHLLARADRQQRRAPMLRGGLEQRSTKTSSGPSRTRSLWSA